MFIEQSLLNDCHHTWPLDIPKEHVLFFDIETTGLSPKTSHLYIIGCCYFKENQWFVKQWFAENSSEEFLMLEQFLAFAEDFQWVITYNGATFDIPYLKEKAKAYLLDENISTQAPFANNIDLYQKVKPYKKIFQLDNLHQKDIEQFLGLHRKDPYTGKELVNVYHKYRKNPNQDCLHQLQLHNLEDMSGMLTSINILAYITVFNGQFQYIEGIQKNQECVLKFTLQESVCHPYTVNCPTGSIHLESNTLIVTLSTKENKLKYYFPEYEKYVILKSEHTVLLKNMVKSVLINEWIPASLENCYQEISVTDKLLSDSKKMKTIAHSFLKWSLRYFKETNS